MAMNTMGRITQLRIPGSNTFSEIKDSRGLLRARSMHECVQGRVWSNELVAWIASLSVGSTVAAFIVTTVLLVLFFAYLLMAVGEGCYEYSSTDYEFSEMVALSIHTFTTIGFGSVYPVGSCTGAHVLVLVEWCFAICAITAFSALLLKAFLEPKPVLRFSKNMVLRSPDPTDPDSVPSLEFRVARVSPRTLR